MNTKIIDAEFSVCVDCLQYLANGDIGDSLPDEEQSEVYHRIEKEYKELKGDNYDVFLGDDYEGFFSSYPCQLCKSHLGGDRFDTNLVEIN